MIHFHYLTIENIQEVILAGGGVCEISYVEEYILWSILSILLCFD
jgi:hypothetical protein